ncbi:hypothetical protein Trydic_g12864 [Trypoxylus dichotomus]
MLIGINLLASNVSCIRCYVCGELNCSDFNEMNKNLFVKQCPSKHVGCVTEKSGNTVITRACQTVKPSECYTINEIDYCFCDTNLCNGPDYTIESDDEELDEGSGTESGKEYPTSTEIIQQKSDSGADVIGSVPLLICTFMWLI